MFGLNKERRVSIHYYPGIYKFQIPFLKNTPVADEDGIVRQVAHCDVEMHVGRKDDLKEGYIVTVILRSTNDIALNNWVEEIATHIRRIIFPYISLTNNFEPDHIRWINVEPPMPGDYHRCSQLIMKWDNKSQTYSQPEWRRVSEDAWYYEKEPYKDWD